MQVLSKCFALSLALHLAGLAFLPYLAATLTPKRPKTMVIDFTIEPSPAAGPRMAERKQPAVVARRVTPPSPAAMVKREPPHPEPLRARDAEARPVAAAASPDAAPVTEVRTTGEGAERKPAAAAGGESTGATAAPPAVTASRGEASPGEATRQRYLKEHFSYIRDLVARKVEYPPMARKMGWTGRAVVTFTVLEDGNTISVRLVERSGFPILDRCALESVRKATPFPRPPCRVEITIPVMFRLL